MPLTKNKNKKNVLDMVPYRVIQNFTEKDGLITLNLPKFKSPIFSKWLVPSGKSPVIHINLDRNGTLVWKQIDGIKSIQVICNTIRETASEENDLSDLEERTAKFITELYKSRFIKFMEEKL